METAARSKAKIITSLLNGTVASLKNVVPSTLSLEKSQQVSAPLMIHFGVAVGIHGDINGKLILTGEASVFGSIGEMMFGMPIEGEMLVSFSGELGNMVTGGLASNMAEDDFHTDITSPTIIQTNTIITDFHEMHHLPAFFTNIGHMEIYLLLD